MGTSGWREGRLEELILLLMYNNKYGISRQFNNLGDSQKADKPKISQSDAIERQRIVSELESQAWEEFKTKNAWKHL